MEANNMTEKAILSVSLSLKSLWDEGITEWEGYHIEYELPNGVNEDELDEDEELDDGYYDLYSDGLVCMDGESCKIISVTANEVNLCNNDGETEKYFSMPKEIFEKAAFCNAERMYKYYENLDNDIVLSKEDIEKAYDAGIIDISIENEDGVNKYFAHIGDDSLVISYEDIGKEEIAEKIMAKFKSSPFQEDVFYYKSVIADKLDEMKQSKKKSDIERD